MTSSVGVAVVPEVLRFGHDEAVAGEDDRPGHLAVVREGERPDVRSGERASAYGEPRPAVAAAGGELERHEQVGAARQGPRADARELARDVVGGEPLALGAGFASLEPVRGQELDARLCRCCDGLRGRQRGQDDERADDEGESRSCHAVLFCGADLYGPRGGP